MHRLPTPATAALVAKLLRKVYGIVKISKKKSNFVTAHGAFVCGNESGNCHVFCGIFTEICGPDTAFKRLFDLFLVY